MVTKTGVISVLLSVPDPQYAAAGTGVPQTGTYATAASTGKVYVSRSGDFQQGGMVVGVEYHAHATGDVKFLVRTIYHTAEHCEIFTCRDQIR